MGRYATTTAIADILPFFLASNTTTSDARGTSVFSKAITQAEAKVNSAVTARYDASSWTSGAIPPLILALSEELACYYAIRAAYTQDGQSRNDYLDDFKSALDTLKKLEEGDIKLTYTDGSLVPTRSGNRFLSTSENYSPVFGLDTATAWKVDPDQVNDLGNART